MNDWPRLIWFLVFLALLAYLTARVLGSLIEPIAWAIILSYAAWPLRSGVDALLKRRSGWTALLLVILLGVAVSMPLIGLTAIMQNEIAEFIRQTPPWLENKSALQSRVADIPLIGSELERLLDPFDDLQDFLAQEIWPRLRGLSRNLLVMIQGAGFVAGKWLLTLFLMFFLFRDGEKLVAEVRQGIQLGLGQRANDYLAAAERTTRAVVYGIVLTAFVQGCFAGLGYWGVGMPAPALLTLATIAFALVPFGVMIAWLLACLWLLIHGQQWESVALFLWGTLVVSWVDNLIRPLVISRATRIPFALVLLGILGGLMGFGLVGLFAGPITLSVVHAVWHEWLHSREMAKGQSVSSGLVSPRQTEEAPPP